MFHQAPVRPVSAAQRTHFQPRSYAAENPVPLPGLAQSAQILARLAGDLPHGRLTASQIVIVARNAQGHYSAEVQAAAAQFHAQRHAVRSAFVAQHQRTTAGSSLFSVALRGYRHADLQALATTFDGRSPSASAAFSQSMVPPAPGWRMSSGSNVAGGRTAGRHGGDVIDDALCHLGHFMQRTRRAFLSVERLLTMERGGSTPARQALDNLSRWGRAAGSVMEDRARLLLSDLEARYGDLDLLERQSERAARRSQQGVFGYPGGVRPPSTANFHPANGPVITEVVDDGVDGRATSPGTSPRTFPGTSPSTFPSAPPGARQTFPPYPVRPGAFPHSSGPVITELVEPAPYRPVAQEPVAPPRQRPRSDGQTTP